MNSEMKLRNLDEIFETDKETSIQKARKRLRECMDDIFAEFLDTNVLSANNNYYFNNGILRNENNTISIDSESINMNSNKYKYNLASKVLSGNDTQINKFIIEAPPSNSIKLGKTSQITYNSDGTGKFI